MAEAAGRKCAPAWVSTQSDIGEMSPEQTRWENRFRDRWNRMTPDQRQRRYRTTDGFRAKRDGWQRIRALVQIRWGRREIRAERVRLTSSEIIDALSDDRAIVEGAMHGKGVNAISLGGWLKERLVDAPINGLVLRSAKDRTNTERFWITEVR